jgi:hypothetical protein
MFLLALLLLRRGSPLPLRKWIGSQVVILVLFAPWVQVLVNHTSIVQRGFWVVTTLGTLLQTFRSYSGNIVLLLLFIALSLCSFVTYTNSRGSPDWKRGLKAAQDYLRGVRVTLTCSVMFLAVWLLTVTAVPFVISYFLTQIFVVRYAIGASAAFYLLAAGGLSNINRRYVKAVVIALIVILSTVSLHQYLNVDTFYIKPNAQESFSVISKNAQSGDAVIAFPGYNKFISDYYGRGINATVTPFPTADYYSMSWKNKNTSENIKELQSDVNGHNRVWFVSTTGYGSAKLLTQAKATLNESYNVQYSKNYGYEVILYVKRV